MLASQCLALDPLKVRRIDVNGTLEPGVYAKDVILTIIRRLGVNGGVGYAYEYGGSTVDAMTIDERMTMCNMSIEGGARAGYVNPDETTFAFLKGRRFAPQGAAFDRAVAWWRQIASDPDAQYDDRVVDRCRDASSRPSRGASTPDSRSASAKRSRIRPTRKRSTFMGFERGAQVAGTRIDVAFIGSCTNGRLSDLEEAARLVKGRRVVRRTSRRSSSPARRKSVGRPKPRACTRSSPRPASSGAAPAARCAWP